MGRVSTFQPALPARWAPSPDPIDEEKYPPNDTPIVPTIVVTPPPSPDLGAGYHARSTFELDPVYLHPPPYLHPLYHNYLGESRQRCLERRRHQSSWWWTLTAVVLLVITTISLCAMYSTYSSEVRALDDLAAGLARQGSDGGAWTPNVRNGDSTVVPLRFELPRFLEWFTVDRDTLSGTAPVGILGDESPRTRRLSILGVIGVGSRHGKDGDTWYS